LPTILKTRKQQKNITIDTLLLVGEHDRAICGYHTIKNFKKYFKNKPLQTYMFQNSGHLCFEEEQPLFIEKVLEFIKK
jgi:pimeloyl-ACP methyl ester carboxylesterase